MNKEWGCAECGLRNLTEETNCCPNCGSVRVVLVEFTEQLLGIKWEDGFKEEY
jgi:RNA polymerase subunit RPABC4/transcription elongation factor Spt4